MCLDCRGDQRIFLFFLFLFFIFIFFVQHPNLTEKGKRFFLESDSTLDLSANFQGLLFLGNRFTFNQESITEETIEHVIMYMECRNVLINPYVSHLQAVPLPQKTLSITEGLKKYSQNG